MLLDVVVVVVVVVVVAVRAGVPGSQTAVSSRKGPWDDTEGLQSGRNTQRTVDLTSALVVPRWFNRRFGWYCSPSTLGTTHNGFGLTLPSSVRSSQTDRSTGKAGEK